MAEPRLAGLRPSRRIYVFVFHKSQLYCIPSTSVILSESERRTSEDESKDPEDAYGTMLHQGVLTNVHLPCIAPTELPLSLHLTHRLRGGLNSRRAYGARIIVRQRWSSPQRSVRSPDRHTDEAAKILAR